MGSETVLSQLYHAARITLILWFAGVTDALCIWRCVEFFVHDPQILKKTGQCFGLNGAIFLGSILLWDYGLAPGMAWMLAGSEAWFGASGTELLLAGLQGLFGLCWLLPVYCISFALSCVWYQEIAELAVRWMGAQAGQPAAKKAKAKAAAAQPPAPLLDAMAQELYRVVLFGVFYAQVSLLAFLPYIGPPLYYVLVSWLYALYSFDYCWSLARARLPDRIHHFQTHSAFFLGFGSVCTVSTCYWPFFTQAAVIAMIYPLFILVACKSDPLAAYKRVADAEAAAGRRLALVQLPIFAPATAATSFILANFLSALRLPQLLVRSWGRLAAVAGCAVLIFTLLAARQAERA